MAIETRHFDAVVIGAGFSGLYMVKPLRDKLGTTVRGYEAGETVGGTWYWNRYPGARCDSDAYIYGCMWDRQLLQNWEWSERYPQQPEILHYLEHVAARHELPLPRERDHDRHSTFYSHDSGNCLFIISLRKKSNYDIASTGPGATRRIQRSKPATIRTDEPDAGASCRAGLSRSPG
jgi:hypothetical protein